MSQIEVNNTINSVDVFNTINTIDISPDTSNVIVVPQETTYVIEVNTPGPQGPPGDPSLLTGSFVSQTEFNEFTSSYNTGSFNGFFTGFFTGDGSGLTGTSKWTGSIDGSITRESNVYVTGSFGVTNQAGNSLFLINSQGSTSIKSTAADIFLIKNQNDVDILTVSQSGILVLATQSIELNSPAPNGGIYFTSSSLFIGID